MRKHSMSIIPLNAFMKATNLYSTPNDMTFDKTKYDVASKCVYMKDEFTSYFKCKATTTGTFIQIPFMGLKPGDYITINFEALTNKAAELRFIISALPYVQGQNYYMSNFTNYFKNYSITIPILASNFNNDINGVFIDFSLNTASTEYTFKNISIDIHTNSPTFKVNNFYQILTKENLDLLYSDRGKLKDIVDATTFADMKTDWQNGLVTFTEDGQAKVSVTQNGTNNGFGVPLYKGTYARNGGIVFEYTSTNGVNVDLMCYSKATGESKWASVTLPTSSTFKKVLIPIGFFGSEYKKNWIKFSKTSSDFVIQNLIIGELECTNEIIDDFDQISLV